MTNPLALEIGSNKMSEADLFHALVWYMGKNLEPMTVSRTLFHDARTLPVSTKHSQNPNSSLREKCSKIPVSALSWPH